MCWLDFSIKLICFFVESWQNYILQFFFEKRGRKFIISLKNYSMLVVDLKLLIWELLVNLMSNIISIFIYNIENLISLVYKNKGLMSETSWVTYWFDPVASEWVKIRCGFGQVNKLRFNFAKSNHTRYMISHTILEVSWFDYFQILSIDQLTLYWR